MMKLFALFSFVFIVLASIAGAQSTIVSGAITDPGGNTWAQGTATAVFQRAPGSPFSPIWSGGNFNPLPPTVTLDTGGNFTMTLPSNTAISPAGSTWNFSICPNASLQCAVVNVSISGATFNMETALNSANAWPTGSVHPTVISKVYSTTQVDPPPLNQGGMVYNTTNQTMDVYTLTGWQPFATVGGVGVVTNPSGSQTIVQPTGSNFSIAGSSATNLVNKNSGGLCVTGSYFNGSPLNDPWCWIDVVGSGTNPTSTLTLTHGGASTGTATVSISSPLLDNNLVSGITPAIDIAWYGAKCDGVTNDAPAIQSATNAAGAIYSIFNTPTNILITKGSTGSCLITSTVNYLSGSHFKGSGGAITNNTSGLVSFQSNPTATLTSGDVSDVEFNGLVINQTTAGSVPGIYYLGGTGTTGGGTVIPTHHFYVKNTTVHGAGYAVNLAVFNQNDGNNHHLSDVQITGNHVYADLVPLATTTASGTVGTTTITVASTTGIGYGDFIIGAGIANGSQVLSIVGLNVTISFPLLSTITNSSTTFNGIDQLARDGIHLAGDISDFHVDNNVVEYRGDAALALTSSGGTTFSTFPANLLPRLTPTNGTVSDNICLDSGAGLDFSGGAQVTAVGDVCTATIAHTSQPQIRFIFDQYPTANTINITGGKFINYYGGGGDPSVVKMDFTGAQVGYGIEPICNCTITGADIGGITTNSLLYFLGQTLTLQNNIFETSIQNISVQSINGFQTTGINLKNNTWMSNTRTLTTASVVGSIAGSSFIDDFFLGGVSTFPIVPNNNTFSTSSLTKVLCGNAQGATTDINDCRNEQLTYGSGANPAVTIATTHTGSAGAVTYTWDAGIKAPGLQLGATNGISSIVNYSPTITPTSVAANSCSDQIFTVTGITTADQLTQLRPPAAGFSNLSDTVIPGGANLIVIHFCNVTAAPITPASGMYQFMAIH